MVTMFYGELDTHTGEMLYVNAGHNAPFLMRAGGARMRPGAPQGTSCASKAVPHAPRVRPAAYERIRELRSPTLGVMIAIGIGATRPAGLPAAT